MRNWVTSKIRLPGLYGLQIEYWTHEDTDVDFFYFLCYFFPAHLNLLHVNCWLNSPIGINPKLFFDAYSKAVARTIKEVSFFQIDFSSKGLQTVVKAASNVEIILFDFCNVHCSSDLDFGAHHNYKTKFLSFQWWGCLTGNQRITDWIADPSRFSFIVEAISSSGLRDSLCKLSIYNNQTLWISEVQEEFNKKGMSHISVVDEEL